MKNHCYFNFKGKISSQQEADDLSEDSDGVVIHREASKDSAGKDSAGKDSARPENRDHDEHRHSIFRDSRFFVFETLIIIPVPVFMVPLVVREVNGSSLFLLQHCIVIKISTSSMSSHVITCNTKEECHGSKIL